MNLRDVLAFIKDNKLAVVASVNAEGKPQAAVVEFGELDDLTIVIDTLTSSRKYHNFVVNPHAAIVIGWDDNVTIQIDAIAHELSGDELAVAKQKYFKKNARAKAWESRRDIAYFAFKPTFVRYSDLSKKPWLIKEFTLSA